MLAGYLVAYFNDEVSIRSIFVGAGHLAACKDIAHVCFNVEVNRKHTIVASSLVFVYSDDGEHPQYMCRLFCFLIISTMKKKHNICAGSLLSHFSGEIESQLNTYIYIYIYMYIYNIYAYT